MSRLVDCGRASACALLAVGAVLFASSSGVPAATKSVDLDGDASNGAESRCELNVLSTFPVRIENVVTNKSIGDAYDFSWPSAGPGGFTSSVTPGSAGGVGAKWTWTTNQSIFSFTGSDCERDICFLQTEGPSPLSSTCTRGCQDDGVALTVAKGATSQDLVLNWSGGTGSYTVYRSADPGAVPASGNELTTTGANEYTDAASAGGTAYYLVRGSTSNDDCVLATEGTCVSRGPFAVPGRSLVSTDVTVSSASLTSSLITFFSPPTEVFRVTSTAQPGGSFETLTNGSTTPVNVVTGEYPPGCCPADPEVPDQLRCGDECVDYLNDPLNCGACGNECGEGDCCTNGNCVSICPAGQILCGGECVDLLNDSGNCGACGATCEGDACCSEGACASFCESDDTWCGDGSCADVQNDTLNCGSCGNDCGEGNCCDGGACVSVCAEDRSFCDDGLCYDLLNDPDNCGACGNSCGAEGVCDDGVCVPCDGHAGAKDQCDNQCVNLNTDPYNCGECGHSCNLNCPSGFTGVCSNGQSCRCVEGTPAPPPPPITPVPVPAFCPNPDASAGSTPGGCPNPNPTSPIAPSCPSPGPPAPEVPIAPTCQANAVDEVVPPGGSTTVCNPGGLLFKEVPAEVTVCGDSIPGPDGTCGEGVSNVAAGTFIRLVPDTETEVGPAFVTPFAVHVIADSSHDWLIAPGESASVVIDVVNAGPVDIVGATATLVSEPVDLTDDGIDNPVGVTVVGGTSSYGTIAGTQPTVACEPLVLQPAANALAFEITVPAEHPSDTAHPFTLQFTGTVDGAPYEMSVPIALGIVDRCVYEAATGDYDGVDGLLSPMADLVPAGDPVPFPSKALNSGNTVPLKLRLQCGGVDLRGGDADPPQIVGLSEATLGPLDILSLNLNDDSDPDDLFFRYNDTNKRWIFNMRTADLGVGTFTLTIRVAGRKEYLTGFELR